MRTRARAGPSDSAGGLPGRAFASAGARMPLAFETLRGAAAQRVQEFDAHDLANTLGAMARKGTQMLDVEALCTAAAQKVQGFKAQEIVNTL